ncbi:DNA polymerase III subunit beta [Trichothermofontia sichuanensis B231]|uniref:DNA polymerase III subunit beta n=1 Tax=Trichothermofontia sichuanensis TaxID=3045816 RepID=UPI002247FF7E|nr:DNA polymerase III subunit beta [Trichothermofontia sichuanensis]UZQ53702.1 DNA polymerase III subunit beta [Trichothermofontia sichuanensis B231]
MKLVCSQSDLSTHLSLVSRAVPTRPTHPVLANVLLAADMATQRVSLTAFDLSLGIQTSFAAQVQAPGEITLPARLLSDIVSRLPGDSEIALAIDPDQPTTARLASRFGHYEVRGLAAADFPELPLMQTAEPVKLAAESLVQGVQGTLFAASSDETKQILTGVHLKVLPDGLEFAATDGHRLAVVETENPPEDAAVSQPPAAGFAVTVPAKALRDLERMIGTSNTGEAIALYFDQGQTVFQWGDQYLTTRTLDGQYPNYCQLIPREFSTQVTVERKLLAGALDRIAVIAEQKNNVVKVTIDSVNQAIALSVEAPDVGSGEEQIPVQVLGEDLEIAFNVKYLQDALKAISSAAIQLQCNQPNMPAIVTPLGAMKMTYLVMPVQIRG